MSVETIETLFVWAMVIPANGFPLLYGFRSPWWVTHIGRALLFHSIGMALLIDMSLVIVVIGQSFPGVLILEVAVLGFLGVGLWYQLLALVIARRQGKPRQGKP